MKISEQLRDKKLNQKLEKILAIDAKISKMTDEELKALSNDLVRRRKNGEPESKLMTEAFALVREATSRTLGMKQYPVQLKGAISIAEGNLAEMATGEGKTLVVPLVAYLHALSGENVHVVTSNEYLAKRDSEQMSKLFEFLGMNVGLSLSGMGTEQKQQAYSCNVTYTTATELGFDYLRDNNEMSESRKVLRGLNSLVIDEADHILLDEASTPLILATKEKRNEGENILLKVIAKLVESFQEGEDYEVDREHYYVSFSEKGFDKIEKFFNINTLFTASNYELFNQCNNALKAKTLFLRDNNYAVVDGEIKIIGETNGRILDGRQYSHGMQQAIEAKENMNISMETKTTSNINFQNFFKLYENLGGMSGTCKTDEEELQKIYGLWVDRIETNRPVVRKDEHFRFYHTPQAKNDALKQRILELHKSGRPILLGTTSVEKSIELAKMLDEIGLKNKYSLLNATNEEKESEIIAQAGRLGAITIATNMAGRGTDIKLGGNHATQIEKEEVEKLGGLAVIGTALNTSRRIDNQLRGRAGRQGENGSSEIYVAWEDIKDTFKIGEESEDAYIDLLKKQIAKKSVNPNAEITDKKIIETIEYLQKSSERMMRASRELNFSLNTPENFQRVALYSEKKDIIKMCDEFDRSKIELDENGFPTGKPKQPLEHFMYELYHKDISKIVEEWCAGLGSSSVDFDPTKQMTEEERKEAWDCLRKKLQKYPTDIKYTYLETHTPKELIDALAKLSLKMFQYTNKDNDLTRTLKRDILSEYNKCWSNHLERLESAKTQLSISQTTDGNAVYDFVKNAYNFFDTLREQVCSNVVASTNATLGKACAKTKKQKQQTVAQTIKKIADEKSQTTPKS